MLSRARVFAAVMLLIGCFAGITAWAQAQNLEAGKSPSQLFAGTCNACHKSPRGLLKTVSTASLPGFLREHYTTSGEMASQLSAFVIANGAAAKQDAKQATGNDQVDRQGRKLRNAPSQETVRPESESPPQAEGGRQARRRLAPPGEASEEVKPASAGPAQAAIERSPDGRRLSVKRRLGRRGQPDGEETPMVKDGEPPKAEPVTDDQAKGETAKEENGAGERTKPDGESKAMETKSGAAQSSDTKSEAVRMEPAKDPNSGEKPVAGQDPAQPVMPAPVPAVAAAPASTMTSGSETSAPTPRAPAAPEPPAVTASAPPAAPLPSSGPPTPPISQ